jgi:hypothetical protein
VTYILDCVPWQRVPLCPHLLFLALSSLCWCTCLQVGDRVFIYGGRHIRGIVPDDVALFVYDVLDNAWYKPDNVSGTAPLTRSSHR